MQARPELELVAPPSTIIVVFRHRGGDEVNTRIHRTLFASGTAVIGRTRVGGSVALKLTLLNPTMTAADVDELLDLVVSAGASTGSLTLRTSPAALRTLPVIQTVFGWLRGFAGSRRRTERTRPAAIERRTTGPRSVRLERSRAVSRTLIAHA